LKDLDIIFKERIRPYLLKSRPGDWEHTLRAVRIGKELLRNEDGDPTVVMPALYLHDIGWSAVVLNEFVQTPVFRREESRSSLLHMRHGDEQFEEDTELLQGHLITSFFCMVCPFVEFAPIPEIFKTRDNRPLMLYRVFYPSPQILIFLYCF